MEKQGIFFLEEDLGLTCWYKIFVTVPRLLLGYQSMAFLLVHEPCNAFSI